MRSVIGVMVWLAAACLAAERPYMAIVEKVAGAVGFYTEDGRQVGHGAKDAARSPSLDAPTLRMGETDTPDARCPGESGRTNLSHEK